VEYEYPADEFDEPNDSVLPAGVHRRPLPAWRNWLPLLLIVVIVPALAWGALALFKVAGGTNSSVATSIATKMASNKTTAKAKATTSASTEAKANKPNATVITTQAPAPTPTPTPTQSIDYTVGITVHNGTDTAGLAGRAGSSLEGAGFTSVTVSPGVYSQETPTESTVYYASEDREAVAKAVAKELGISNVELSAEQASSNPIVVVLRS
jgi:hypothetical protein